MVSRRVFVRTQISLQLLVSCSIYSANSPKRIRCLVGLMIAVKLTHFYSKMQLDFLYVLLFIKL